jgi:hypothetical protein
MKPEEREAVAKPGRGITEKMRSGRRADSDTHPHSQCNRSSLPFALHYNDRTERRRQSIARIVEGGL